MIPGPEGREVFRRWLVESGCVAFDPECATLARSLYSNGALARLIDYGRMKWREDHDDIRCERDVLELEWRIAQEHRHVHEAMASADAGSDTLEGMVGGVQSVLDALRAPSPSYRSLRGRGARRQAFEAYVDALEADFGRPFSSREPGRPPLLSSVLAPPPNLHECEHQLIEWVGHVREATDPPPLPIRADRKTLETTKRASAVDHVCGQVALDPLFVAHHYLRIEDDSVDDDLKMAITMNDPTVLCDPAVYFFQTFLGLAVHLNRSWGQWRTASAWQAGAEEWERRRPGLVRRMLSWLTGGVLSEQQVRDQLRAIERSQ